MKIRIPVATATAVAALLVVGVTTPAYAGAEHGHGAHPIDWAGRAVAANQALETNLGAGSGLFLEKSPLQTGDNPYSYLWPMREATSASIALAGIPGVGERYRTTVSTRFSAIEKYFSVAPDGRAGFESYLPAPLGAGGDVFYDDNAVVGLSYFTRFEATGRQADLKRAQDAFAIVQRGWDADPSRLCPGGMDWIDTPTNTVRGANVTGLAAELAAHLYEKTRDGAYLTWATKMFDWNNVCLKQSDGLYLNSRNHDGLVDPTLWTYNSGAMIGTATVLYRATGDSGYLAQARQAADASLAYWTAGDRLHSQPAIFNAIYFNNLLLLDSVAHNPEYRSAISEYADATWQSNRDPASGLFRFQPSGGGDYDPAARAETLEQSAMIQIFAALAWSPRDYHRIA